MSVHIEDHRTGLNWCRNDPRTLGSKPVVRALHSADCLACEDSYRGYRRMTALAAVGGLAIDPDTAERAFRWGDDSATLRARLRRTNP